MAVVNRYTQLPQDAYTYNPRSLQELMIAPAYMRQQHNALEENIAAAETALAKINNDPLHDPLVKAEQERLYKQLQEQANQLQSEGFNSANKSAFLRFNKDYQNSIGPKGLLGQAQQYYANKLADRNEFIKNMTTQGYSSQQAIDYWNKKVALNEELFNGENIIPYESIYGPGYENLEEDIDKVIKIAGEETKTELAKSGASLQYIEGENGEQVPVFVTQSGNILKSDNINNLLAGIKVVKDKWLNESGAGYKANEVLGYSTDYINDTINNRFAVARKKAVQDNTRTNYQLDNYARQVRAEKQAKEDNATIYENPVELVKTDIAQRTYTENITKMNELLNTPKTDPNYNERIAEGRAMQDIMAKVDYTLSSDNEYNKAKQVLKNTNKEIISKAKEVGLPNEYIKMLENYDGKIYVSGADVIVLNDGSPYGKQLDLRQIMSKDDKLSQGRNLGQFIRSKEEQYNNAESVINKKKNSIISSVSIPYTGFIVDVTNDTADYWKRHTNQVIDAMVDQGAVGNRYKIDSYYVGSTGDTKGLESADKENLVQKSLFDELIKASKKGNAQITQQFVTGSNGLPMIEFRFIPDEKFEIDGSDSTWDKVVEKGEPVTMRVALNRFEGDTSAPLVENLMISSLETQGGVKGKLAAQDMRSVAKYQNIKPSYRAYEFGQSEEIKNAAPWFRRAGAGRVNLYKDPAVGKYQYFVDTGFNENSYEAQTLKWNHIITPEILNDDNTLSKLPPKLLQHFNAYFMKTNPYGIDSSNINSIKDEQLDVYLSNFLNEYGNSPIEFDTKERALNTFK